MKVHSIGDVAARLTERCGEFVATHRVGNAVRRLIASGQIPERRAGRARVILDSELTLVAELLHVTDRAPRGAILP
ncbi:MAG: hypothetical protein U1D55_00230 [Phycisphaerae bacterium]